MTLSASVCRGSDRLGSCVAVSAALLPQQLADLSQQQQQHWQPDKSAADSATSVLLTHGSQDRELSRADVEATVAAAQQLGGHCC